MKSYAQLYKKHVNNEKRKVWRKNYNNRGLSNTKCLQRKAVCSTFCRRVPVFKMALVGDFRVESTMLVLYILTPDVSFYINNTILT